MAVVVIGGHTRNIGKTSVVAGIVAALPEFRWVAVKITQFGHGVCSANGEPCDCETADHTMAVSEERERASGTDSSRYLEAGAQRSFWVRTRQGQLQEAMPRVRRLIQDAEAAGSDVIVESNSVLRFLRPELFLSVMDPGVEDFKPSALRYLDRADALVLSGEGLDHAAWRGVGPSLLRKRMIRVMPPEYSSEELAEFVRERMVRVSVGRQG